MSTTSTDSITVQVGAHSYKVEAFRGTTKIANLSLINANCFIELIRTAINGHNDATQFTLTERTITIPQQNPIVTDSIQNYATHWERVANAVNQLPRVQALRAPSQSPGTDDLTFHMEQVMEQSSARPQQRPSGSPTAAPRLASQQASGSSSAQRQPPPQPAPRSSTAQPRQAQLVSIPTDVQDQDDAVTTRLTEYKECNNNLFRNNQKIAELESQIQPMESGPEQEVKSTALEMLKKERAFNMRILSTNIANLLTSLRTLLNLLKTKISEMAQALAPEQEIRLLVERKGLCEEQLRTFEAELAQYRAPAASSSAGSS